MERLGLRFFRRLSERYPRNFSPDEIHILNPQERRELRRLQRDCVIRAAIAGGISAAVSVVIGFALEPMLQGQIENPPWELYLPYWGLVTILTVGVTFIEIGFLYWDALRTVHRISAVAGLELFPPNDSDAAVTMALVRAALELPNPPSELERVNPRREISKFRLLLGTLVYKLKATATNFILKAVVRRIVGRSGFRALIEFVAVPVYGFWNALICSWVLRQARIRAMGPSAVSEFCKAIFRDAGEVSPEAGRAAFRAVGAAIVRTVEVHPNHVALMKVLEQHLGDPGDIVLDSSSLFLEDLAKVPHQEQPFVLRVLALATIIDGKLALREKLLLQEAYVVAGLPLELTPIQKWRRAFVHGDDVDEGLLLPFHHATALQRP